MAEAPSTYHPLLVSSGTKSGYRFRNTHQHQGSEVCSFWVLRMWTPSSTRLRSRFFWRLVQNPAVVEHSKPSLVLWIPVWVNCLGRRWMLRGQWQWPDESVRIISHDAVVCISEIDGGSKELFLDDRSTGHLLRGICFEHAVSQTARNKRHQSWTTLKVYHGWCSPF